MRIVILSAEEAASPQILKNVADQLLGEGAVAFTAMTPAPVPPIVSGYAPPSPIERAFDATKAALAGELPPVPPPPAIDPLDNPAVGHQANLPPSTFDTVAAFGGAGNVVAAPQPPAIPAAVVVPSPIAPVAPPASLVPTLPVPAPPIATAAPVLPVPAAPLISAASGFDLDAEGLPWDSRIHASSKVKNAGDGTWRAKRGADEALVAQVKAQLRQAMGAPVVAAPPPPVAVAQQPVTFADISKQVMDWMMSGKLAATDIHGVCTRLGLGGLPDLNVRVDLIPAAQDAFKQIVASRP